MVRSPLVYLRHYMIQFYNMDKISMGPSLLHPQEESLSGPSINPLPAHYLWLVSCSLITKTGEQNSRS